MPSKRALLAALCAGAVVVPAATAAGAPTAPAPPPAPAPAPTGSAPADQPPPPPAGEVFAPAHPSKIVPWLKAVADAAAANLDRSRAALSDATQALDTALSGEAAAVTEVSGLDQLDAAQAMALSRARTGMAELAVDSYEAGGPSVPGLAYVLQARTPWELVRREAVASLAGEVLVRHAVSLARIQKETHGAAVAAAADMDSADRALWAARDQLAKAQAALPAAQAAFDQAKAAYDLAASAAPQPGTDIPQIVLAAYQQAAATLAGTDPSCHLIWQDIAGVGRLESGHAQHADTQLAANGDTWPPILGPALDGTSGFAALPQPAGITYDGPGPWERAVGPMQFLPTTWARVGADGNGDGVSDPNNVFDAALGAGRYLCLAAGRAGLASTDGLSQAYFSYNHDQYYVYDALQNAVYYGAPITLPPAPPPPPPAPAPGTTTSTLPPASATPPPATPPAPPGAAPPDAAAGSAPTTTTTTAQNPVGPAPGASAPTSTTSAPPTGAPPPAP